MLHTMMTMITVVMMMVMVMRLLMAYVMLLQVENVSWKPLSTLCSSHFNHNDPPMMTMIIVMITIMV